MKQSSTKKINHLRQPRVFSEAIKRSTVQDIEKGKCTVNQASKELCVSSQSIYRWIYRFSRYLVKNRVMVVEDKSEAYRSQELEKRIKELEATVGRKQMEIDLLSKVIDLANEEFHTDLKKNLSNKLSSNSGSEKDSPTGTK